MDEKSVRYAVENGNLNTHKSMTTDKTPSANEDHAKWLIAPDQIINVAPNIYIFYHISEEVISYYELSV